jgi:hypothetical protein
MQLASSALYRSKTLNTQKNRYILNKKFWEKLIAYFPLYDTDRIENDSAKCLYSCVCICCCGNVFNEPLPSNDRGYT